MARRYKIVITPLIQDNVYSNAVDVSDYADVSDVSSIKSGTDSGDFDFGVFIYDHITIKLLNKNGLFNEPQDTRSIFKYKRDLAKVDITFYDHDDSSTISFKGLINEEATRLNVKSEEIKFKVLSLDSVIRSTKITSGQVTTGMTFQTALQTILNVPRITSVLNYVADNIDPALNLTVDVGSWFNDRNLKDSLDKLLLASNSIFVVDKETSNMIVKGRDDHGETVNRFYGPGDLPGRENILDVKNYNSGFHRTFNSLTINDTVVFDQTSIDMDGSKNKTILLPFITSDVTEEAIGNAILEEFKVSKIELEILVKQVDAKNLEFLDLVSVDYPPRVFKIDGNRIPFYAVAKYGSDNYPGEGGPLVVSKNLAFKVIGFKEFPEEFVTLIKLRQRGTSFSDGDLINAGSFYGTAVYANNTYRPETIQPATYGSTRYLDGEVYGN